MERVVNVKVTVRNTASGPAFSSSSLVFFYGFIPLCSITAFIKKCRFFRANFRFFFTFLVIVYFYYETTHQQCIVGNHIGHRHGGLVLLMWKLFFKHFSHDRLQLKYSPLEDLWDPEYSIVQTVARLSLSTWSSSVFSTITSSWHRFLFNNVF